MDLMLKAQPERLNILKDTLKTISNALHRDPLAAGESREDNRRV
jgi:hypothetical protein